MIGQTPPIPDHDPGTQPSEPTPPTPGEGGGTAAVQKEIGGRDGPEPTRYGDWEKNGRCIDF
ncbi:MAG: hypothetical protein DI562_16530 [Stenotrophomonas acidaminiphila]|jgi:hypothetical protein|uniref:DUF1674 domain-containing protein n=1 Tax=Pseudoxanthomonas TaxID=83618 RepID=UPI000DB8E7BA|nr:DUF1674 domain-containing protein [Pseudoxanthomonas sp.]NCT72505.1 DUF1674 domain-containing protein [Xanthomonadaceae bacterium]PZQ25395.1 MAG: hypothetical protein DI562_16530 [Stenotrophomonas acidaminiphila]